MENLPSGYSPETWTTIRFLLRRSIELLLQATSVIRLLDAVLDKSCYVEDDLASPNSTIVL